MTALAAFNPDGAATMQFIETELLDQLAEGTPLGVAMVNVSLLLAPPSGGDVNAPIDKILTQIGPMLTLAPTVIAGALTVLTAIPGAMLRVVGVVVTAVFNTAAAAGSDGFGAAVETGLYNVMNAAAKEIATVVEVVRNVLHDIAAVATGGSALKTAAPGAVSTSGTAPKTDTTLKRANASATPRGIAGLRPRHSAAESAPTRGSRPAESARATVKRDSRPSVTRSTARSAR